MLKCSLSLSLSLSSHLFNARFKKFSSGFPNIITKRNKQCTMPTFNCRCIGSVSFHVERLNGVLFLVGQLENKYKLEKKCLLLVEALAVE